MEKNMKKTFLVIVVTLVLALASSCATTVWDETIPPEKSATSVFYLNVTSYNGIGVSKWNSVRIPAGEAVIGGDVTVSHAGVRIFIPGMEFVCHLEAGKEYSVIGAARDGKWGVNLYEDKKLSTKSFVAFIPFTHQPERSKSGGY
jgi:hypothetical protein